MTLLRLQPRSITHKQEDDKVPGSISDSYRGPDIGVRNYDQKCLDLAEYFLEKEVSEDLKAALAQQIQTTVEDFVMGMTRGGG